MRIRMKIDVSGSRDGEPWPKRGETLNVSDAEGADLCASGLAAPVADDDVEKAVEPDDSEQRALTTESAAAVTPAPSEEDKPAPAKKAAAKRTTTKSQAEGK